MSWSSDEERAAGCQARIGPPNSLGQRRHCGRRATHLIRGVWLCDLCADRALGVAMAIRIANRKDRKNGV